MEQSRIPAKKRGQKKMGGKETGLKWHPAFIGAIKTELENYKNCLDFNTEVPLTAEPLVIDCVIIKKTKNTIIQKNIGRIFREVNILEYKSPTDYIAVSDFYKVYSYSCLYICLNKIPVTNLTITLIGSRYPRELFQHLKNVRGYAVDEISPGIYNITGDILPIQVINRQRLSAKENLWLKTLGSELDRNELDQLIKEIQRRPKTPHLEPYLDVVIRANPKIFKEGIKMRKRVATLEEVFVNSGLADIYKAEAKVEARAEINAEAFAEAVEKKALAIAKNMAKMGLPVKTIVSATELKPKKVREIFQQL